MLEELTAEELEMEGGYNPMSAINYDVSLIGTWGGAGVVIGGGIGFLVGGPAGAVAGGVLGGLGLQPLPWGLKAFGSHSILNHNPSESFRWVMALCIRGI